MASKVIQDSGLKKATIRNFEEDKSFFSHLQKPRYITQIKEEVPCCCESVGDPPACPPPPDSVYLPWIHLKVNVWSSFLHQESPRSHLWYLVIKPQTHLQQAADEATRQSTSFCRLSDTNIVPHQPRGNTHTHPRVRVPGGETEPNKHTFLMGSPSWRQLSCPT